MKKKSKFYFLIIIVLLLFLLFFKFKVNYESYGFVFHEKGYTYVRAKTDGILQINNKKNKIYKGESLFFIENIANTKNQNSYSDLINELELSKKKQYDEKKSNIEILKKTNNDLIYQKEILHKQNNSIVEIERTISNYEKEYEGGLLSLKEFNYFKKLNFDLMAERENIIFKINKIHTSILENDYKIKIISDDIVNLNLSEEVVHKKNIVNNIANKINEEYVAPIDAYIHEYKIKSGQNVQDKSIVLVLKKSNKLCIFTKIPDHLKNEVKQNDNIKYIVEMRYKNNTYRIKDNISEVRKILNNDNTSFEYYAVSCPSKIEEISVGNDIFGLKVKSYLYLPAISIFDLFKGFFYESF